VISVIIAADLMRGTGRFNLAQGLVALSVGIGAGLSNLTAGFVVQWFGYPIGFLYLAAIAVGGLLFSAVLMPETRPEMTAQASRPCPLGSNDIAQVETVVSDAHPVSTQQEPDPPAAWMAADMAAAPAISRRPRLELVSLSIVAVIVLLAL
jgi:MFS family permease